MFSFISGYMFASSIEGDYINYLHVHMIISLWKWIFDRYKARRVGKGRKHVYQEEKKIDEHTSE